MKTKLICAATVAALTMSLLSGCNNTPSSSESLIGATVKSSIQNMSAQMYDAESPISWKTQSYKEYDLSNGDVSITSSGIYVLSGELQEGAVTVNVDKSVDKGTIYLIFNGVDISSSTKTPINIIEGKNVVIQLESGSDNKITQGEITTIDTEFPSAALFSKADLSIIGDGNLTVTTKYNDGITSKDDLIISGGNITVNSVGDGIVGKDLLAIENSTINVTAGKDGLRSTNSIDVDKGNIVITSGTLTIFAESDGIQAEKNLEITDGTFNISTGGGYPGSSIKVGDTAGGGKFGGFGNGEKPNRQNIPTTGATQKTPVATDSTAIPIVAIPITTATNLDATPLDSTSTDTTDVSRKGLKAGSSIKIYGGIFNLSIYEDAIHSNSDIVISGGTFTINAGDDGIHADNSVIINDGTLDIQNSYEGIEAANEITINGGTVKIVSSDDGINISSRTGNMNFNGGDIFIKSSGDGIDSNGNTTQTGGDIVIDKSSIGPADEAVDYDGTYTGTGGTIKDQNGDVIDATIQRMMGGGGKMPNGERPNGNTKQERPAPTN